MQTLFKRDTTGSIRTWRMEIEGSRFRTIAGLHGGAQVRSAWTQAVPKNIGRSNETSPEAQAEAEVSALYTKKMERGYTLDVDKVDEQKFRSPMLAKVFTTLPTGLLFSQPKLDGIRCIIDSEGMWSRTGKPILGALHIYEALAPFFAQNPMVEFDGELYNHELHDDFNEIVSMVRRTETTAKSREIVQYHVYDLISHANLPFDERNLALEWLLRNDFDPMVQMVPTDQVVDRDHLDSLYEEYMESGYEGQMVRLNEPYEFKRSKHLLKRKEFQDAEFEIIRIEEGLGNWAGYAKKVICKLPDGREFGAGIAGTQAQTKTLLAQADDMVGKEATITFFNLTPDGIPRFGIAKTIHQEARI